MLNVLGIVCIHLLDCLTMVQKTSGYVDTIVICLVQHIVFETIDDHTGYVDYVFEIAKQCRLDIRTNLQ